MASTNLEWNKHWNYFQNMGKDEPICIKKELYKYIHSYLKGSQKQLFFFTGKEKSGKTTFIKKAVLYTINRKLFD